MFPIWLIILVVFGIPGCVYGLFWLGSRAFYSGKLSAIRSAFYKHGKRRQ